MAYLVYVIEVSAQGLAAEVLVNGASAFNEPLGVARFLQTKLNPFLIEGANEIEVLLGPPPPPPPPEDGEEPAKPLSPAFKLRAFRAEWGVEGPDEVLAEYTYANDPELPKIGRVSVVKLPFDAGAAHGRWSWQSASPYSPAERADVVKLVADAHAMLEARDADGLGALMKTKLEELARAVDTPFAELEKDQHDYLARLFQSIDWKVAPLDPAALVVSPSAGGRLVQVTDPSGRPPLRAKGGGKPFALSITVSHLKDGFRIVR